MSEQVQSAEERAREVIVERLDGGLCGVEETGGSFTYECGNWDARAVAGELLSAVTEDANLTIIDTAELAQLRADLDAAMAFVEEWLAVGKTPSEQGKPTLTNVLGMMKAGRCLDALAPALDRWRQRRQEVGA